MAIKSLTPKFNVIYFCGSAARFARAKFWGGDPGGDRLRGACAVVGEQGKMLCAVSPREVCKGLNELFGAAGSPGREGGSAPCEVVYAIRGVHRR